MHEFFFIIKVEFPINNAAMKRNAIQIIIHLIFHFIDWRCKGNIVLKCNTTMLFDWMIIAVHPQSCSLHFLDFVQFYAGNPSFNTSLNPICIEILPLNLYLVIQTIFNTLKELYYDLISLHWTVSINDYKILRLRHKTESNIFYYIQVWIYLQPNFP